MNISDVMTNDPLTLTPNASLSDARSLMYEKRIRHVPIIEEGRLVGLVTQRDILAAEQSSLLSLPAKERLAQEKTVTLNEFMKTELVTIEAQASILQAAVYLQKHKLGCLPVMEGDKLIGIITDSDFVNVAINLLEIDQDETLDNED